MNTLQNWADSLQNDLSGLEKNHQLRTLYPHRGRLDFSSNDYLSLNSSGKMNQLLQDTLRDWNGPVGSTGSRLIRGHYEVFEKAESEFANYTAQGSALLFHSGYAANTGAIPALMGARDLVFCDRLCHATILDGIRLSGAARHYFKHNDLADLRSQLEKHTAKKSSRSRIWITSESVFSMDGDLADLIGLVKLAEEFQALLYIDEAHSLGILGERGAGLVADAKLQDKVAVTVYPCGKAPGLMGAFVCGPAPLKSFLLNTTRSFIFTTSQPPLLAELLRRTIQFMESPKMDEARRKLADMADYLRTELNYKDLDTGASRSPIIPVILGEASKALDIAEKCRAAGLDVRAIRPPSVPKGQSRLRLTLQAAHSRADIQELLDVLG